MNQFQCFSLSFLFILPVFLLSGCSSEEPVFECSDPLGCVEISPEAKLKIGVLQALSGDVAPLGQAQIRGLELALDKRKGMILGQRVSLQIEDTGCSAEGGANAALKIIADPQMLAIYGTTCSGAAATAAKAMSDAGLIMISGNNSAPFLTSIAGKKGPDWQAGYFRTAPNEENAGAVAASFAFVKQGLTRAVVINDNDIYTRGLTESFKKSFVELGGTVVLDTSVDKGDVEMLPVLTAAGNAKAEVLFFPLFQPEGNHLLLQARRLPVFDDVLMISGGALMEESFLASVGEAGKGMCFVGPSVPTGSAVQELTRAYIEKYKEKPSVSYFLSGFDAAELLFHVIENTAVQDSKGHLHIGRQQLRKTMYAIREYNGVSGELSCDKFGDCAAPSFEVLRLDDPAAGIEGLEKNVIYPSDSL